MPTAKELQQAILDADTPEAFVRAVHALYRNLDHADALSRESLYLHLGMAIGMIERMLREGAAPRAEAPDAAKQRVN